MAVVAVGLTACKKEYTCTCKTTSGSSTVSASGVKKDTKKNAKSDCEAGSKTVAGSYTTTCTLN